MIYWTFISVNPYSPADIRQLLDALEHDYSISSTCAVAGSIHYVLWGNELLTDLPLEEN